MNRFEGRQMPTDASVGVRRCQSRDSIRRYALGLVMQELFTYPAGGSLEGKVRPLLLDDKDGGLKLRDADVIIRADTDAYEIVFGNPVLLEELMGAISIHAVRDAVENFGMSTEDAEMQFGGADAIIRRLLNGTVAEVQLADRVYVEPIVEFRQDRLVYLMERRQSRDLTPAAA